MRFPDGTAAGGSWIWLSRVLDGRTPAYGGGPGLEVMVEKSIERGDSSNAVRLAFSNHLGSHVDAPLHFDPKGRSVEEFAPEDWLFPRSLLIDVPFDGAELITPLHLEKACVSTADTDLLLVRTGFGRRRSEERFWREGPGFAADTAAWLSQRFPGLSAIGMDSISLTSFQHREEGRRAHAAFLSRGLRIFEDLALENVPSGHSLAGVIALPLRFARGDGAPCCVIGQLA